MKNNRILKLKKNVISDLGQTQIIGGAAQMIDGGSTYTCPDSPMTSCNGQCPQLPKKTDPVTDVSRYTM